MNCPNCASQYFTSEIQLDIHGDEWRFQTCSECDRPSGKRVEVTYVDQDPGDQTVS